MAFRRYRSGQRSYDVFDDTRDVSQPMSHLGNNGYDPRYAAEAQAPVMQSEAFGEGSMSEFDAMRADMFGGMDSFFARQGDLFQSSMRDMFDGFMGGGLLERQMNGGLFENMRRGGGSSGSVTSSYEYRSTSRSMGPDGRMREESVYTKTGPDGIPSTRHVFRDQDGTERVTVTRGDSSQEAARIGGFWNDPYSGTVNPDRVNPGPEYDPPQIEELPDEDDSVNTRNRRLLEAPPFQGDQFNSRAHRERPEESRSSIWNSWRSTD